MRTYGQYCPIARGAEIFAERWTPLIIRNVHLGCETFGQILEGAPGLSRTLLTQRLIQLERLGVIQSAPKPQGRGHRYQLTDSGHDLFKVCQTLGEWGARWLEIAPENLDPFVALWSMCNALQRDRLPDHRRRGRVLIEQLARQTPTESHRPGRSPDTISNPRGRAGAAVAGLTVLVALTCSIRELRRAERADESERAQPAKVAEEPGGPSGSQGAAGNG